MRSSAIGALGSTQSAKAEQVLLAIASVPGDPAQTVAIAALGRMGTDTGVAKLISLATTAGDRQTSNAAVYALGNAQSPAAQAALRTLIDSPDSRIAAAALASVDTVDEDLLHRLERIVKNGDPELVSAAIEALAHAGEDALPVLKEAALVGTRQTRYAAITALGTVGGDKAIAMLGEILKTGDRQSAQGAAGVLAHLGGAQAREMLIESALSDRAQLTGALDQLQLMQGEDVEQALISVVKQGSSADKRAALPRLLKAGNPEAVALAIDLANKGSRNEKADAMRMLADSGTPKAFSALVDIAGKSRGMSRIQALELVARAHPSDPAVGQMLADSLFSGRRDEAQYAAGVLGRIGTEDAKSALM
ncbi:MAG: HEAT repeat domain-containing protein, partial [Kofleriaceae bacterium]